MPSLLNQDITPGKKMDMVPMSGTMSAASMSIRAATVTILDMIPVECPRGIVQNKKKDSTSEGVMLHAGDGSCIV